MLGLYCLLCSHDSFAQDKSNKQLEEQIENADIGVFDACIDSDNKISVIAVPPSLSNEQIKYAVQYTLIKYREKYPQGFITVYCYDANKVERAEGEIGLFGDIKVTIK